MLHKIFKIFIPIKCKKIRLSPNLESDLQMRIKIILGEGLFFTCHRALCRFDLHFNRPNISNVLKHCCKRYWKCVGEGADIICHC